MAVNPNELMSVALAGQGYPQAKDAAGENDDFAYGRRWNDAYPFKMQEYQWHDPTLMAALNWREPLGPEDTSRTILDHENENKHFQIQPPMQWHSPIELHPSSYEGIFGIPPMADDVVPLPISPAPTAGPTDKSAQFSVGRATDPQVAPMNPLALEQWWRNQTLRRRGY